MENGNNKKKSKSFPKNISTITNEYNDDKFEIIYKGEVVRSRHMDIDIPEKDPFVNDKLERSACAKELNRLILLYQFDGAVIGLNGTWGSGKTTFVKMWKQELKNTGFPVVYYNAWEDDFSEEPLFSMLHEIKKVAETNGGEKLEKLLEIGAKVGTSFITGALDVIIGSEKGKGLLGRLIPHRVPVKMIAGGVKESTKQIEKIVLDSLKKEDNVKNQMKVFRKTLEEYVAWVCDSGKPLVFFVDELDRCNPTFAVKVLERIKHLFDVSKVVFVLAIDKQQLAYAINGYFGCEKLNSEEYLRRFINIEYSLPEVLNSDYCRYLTSYYGFEIVIQERMAFEDFVITGFYIALYNSLNLRQIDKVLSLARIAYPFDKGCETPRRKIYVYLIMCYFKVFKFDLFSKIKKCELTIQELVDNLEMSYTPIPAFCDPSGITGREAFPSIYFFVMASLIYSYEKYTSKFLNLEIGKVFDESGIQNIRFNKFPQGVMNHAFELCVIERLNDNDILRMVIDSLSFTTDN